MEQYNSYRVAIIEPSQIIREGIRTFVEAEGCFRVTGSHADLQPFDDSRIKKQDFDIILINPAVIRQHRQFNVRNLFTGCDGVRLVAILYQYVDVETLQSFDAVLDIYGDGDTLPGQLLKIIEAEKNESDTATDSIDLSDREKEILVAVASGMTNKEIAEKLFISIHTVISHRKNITRKTGIKTVSGLTIYAIFNNLVSPE